MAGKIRRGINLWWKQTWARVFAHFSLFCYEISEACYFRVARGGEAHKGHGNF